MHQTRGGGGSIDLSVPSQTNPYGGQILVLSSLSLSYGGGLEGIGGAAGGANGVPGSPGSPTVFGEITITSPALGPEGGAVIQGTQQVTLQNNAPSTEDTQKKNEDNKKKNQAAACK